MASPSSKRCLLSLLFTLPARILGLTSNQSLLPGFTVLLVIDSLMMKSRSGKNAIHRCKSQILDRSRIEQLQFLFKDPEIPTAVVFL